MNSFFKYLPALLNPFVLFLNNNFSTFVPHDKRHKKMSKTYSKKRGAGQILFREYMYMITELDISHNCALLCGAA